ncbi:MAG: OmpA family protein [candidate division Zixibacteria bacterium]|nr:OmpA family protein [candidate division Zixibacteria bacterium]
MKIGLLLLMVLLVSAAAALPQPAPSGFGDMNQTLVFTPGAGLLFPVGDFDDANDLGFTVGSGLEYFVSPRLSLLLNYSYLSFSDPAAPAPSVPGESFHFLGLGGRGLLFHDARLNPYLRAAGGLYQAASGSKAGANGGPGVLYRISQNVGLFAEGSAHFVFDYGSGASSTANFLGISAGLALTFPTGNKSRTVERKPGEPPLAVVKEERRDEPGAQGAADAAETGLAPVYFEFDRYDLDSEAKAALGKNAEVLQARPGLKIELEGHCDEIGTEEYNIGLGWKRAEAVKKYLIESGTDPSRLATLSYGKKRPVYLGADAASRAKNRRVEFKIISP